MILYTGSNVFGNWITKCYEIGPKNRLVKIRLALPRQYRLSLSKIRYF